MLLLGMRIITERFGMNHQSEFRATFAISLVAYCLFAIAMVILATFWFRGEKDAICGV